MADATQTTDTLAGWTPGQQQTTDCVINGFYPVGPADGPPVAYVFGRENAARIAAAPAMAEALEEIANLTPATQEVCLASTMGQIAIDALRLAKEGR